MLGKLEDAWLVVTPLLAPPYMLFVAIFVLLEAPVYDPPYVAGRPLGPLASEPVAGLVLVAKPAGLPIWYGPV